MDITPLCIHSSLMNCFNEVILIRLWNELKFHVLSRDGKMLELSPGIEISFFKKVDIALCAVNHRYTVQLCIIAIYRELVWPTVLLYLIFSSNCNKNIWSEPTLVASFDSVYSQDSAIVHLH